MQPETRFSQIQFSGQILFFFFFFFCRTRRFSGGFSLPDSIAILDFLALDSILMF